MAKVDLSMLSRETLVELVRLYAQNANSIDGLWFSCVEEKYGLEQALEMDNWVWARVAPIEARRIKNTLGIAEGGISALARLISFQTWSQIPGMEFEFPEFTEDKLVLNFTECRIQQARLRDGRGEFPCKGVALLALGEFAKAIDPRLTTRCLVCPPDEHPRDLWCSWEFKLA